MIYSTRGVIKWLIKHEANWSALSETRPLLDRVLHPPMQVTALNIIKQSISYRVQSKWIRFVKCHSFSGEHREVGLRTTKDHTVVTSTTTLTNGTAMKWESKPEQRERERGEGRECL